MWYAPIGLLLWRVGLTGCAVSAVRFWWLAAAALLGPFLAIGARGPAFLFVIGFIYVRHRYERRFRPVQIVSVVVLLLVAAPVIVSYRNLRPAERAGGVSQARIGVTAFLSEIGSTYRPYYGIVAMMQSGQQEYLHGRSYLTALGTLLPNLGAVDKVRPEGYYRTNTWFNYRLSPVDDANGVGIGCSMIAEHYANFGYVGVLGAFAVIGGAIVWLETQAVTRRSVLARALLAVLFVPLCWYIRDDIFGTLRMCVWPVAALMTVRVLRLPLAREASVPERH
jgi:oligosaccharide repeat unit polymerase